MWWHPPHVSFTVRSAIYADGDIVIWDGRGIAGGDGQPHENSYAWIMRLADGNVIDGTAFYDRISFNDLWADVQPASAPRDSEDRRLSN